MTNRRTPSLASKLRGLRAAIRGRPAAIHRTMQDDASTKTPMKSLDHMDDLLAHLAIRGLRPTTILDIGAAKGYWSANAKQFFPESNFVLFEPLSLHFKELERTVSTHPTFSYHPFALGEAEADSPININEQPEGSSLLEYYDEEGQERTIVKVRRLDDLIARGEVPKPDMMKIDVQGFELQTLRGAEEALKSTELLIIEVNMFRFMPECPLAHEIIAHLAERGFVLYDLAATLRRPTGNDLGQMDLVFARADSQLTSNNAW
ncbi:MAG: FkbM family methyltransferase [Planctomycetota bacterium]